MQQEPHEIVEAQLTQYFWTGMDFQPQPELNLVWAQFWANNLPEYYPNSIGFFKLRTAIGSLRGRDVSDSDRFGLATGTGSDFCFYIGKDTDPRLILILDKILLRKAQERSSSSPTKYFATRICMMSGICGEFRLREERDLMEIVAADLKTQGVWDMSEDNPPQPQLTLSDQILFPPFEKLTTDNRMTGELLKNYCRAVLKLHKVTSKVIDNKIIITGGAKSNQLAVIPSELLSAVEQLQPPITRTFSYTQSTEGHKYQGRICIECGVDYRGVTVKPFKVETAGPLILKMVTEKLGLSGVVVSAIKLKGNKLTFRIYSQVPYDSIADKRPWRDVQNKKDALAELLQPETKHIRRG